MKDAGVQNVLFEMRRCTRSLKFVRKCNENFSGFQIFKLDISTTAGSRNPEILDPNFKL